MIEIRRKLNIFPMKWLNVNKKKNLIYNDAFPSNIKY